MKSFFYTLKQAFLQIFRNKAMSLASIFAIMAMLLILSIFFILVININTAAQAIQQDYDSIELFLKDGTSEEQAHEIIADFEKEKGVEDVYYKTREDALADFRTRWGDNAYLLDSLSENPLPDSVVILISDLEQASGLAKDAAAYDSVEDVKFYKDTVDKLLKATHFIQIAAIVVMVFLIIVSVVVVTNTIKLTVVNRSNEIGIMKYVGATNWFIRGPFLAEGIIIGMISAGISIGLSALIYERLIEVLGEQMVSMLSVPMVPVDFLVVNFLWIFLALGISIGACGSIISMRKFLDK